MSATVRDVVINIALNGLSAAMTGVDQLKNSLNTLHAGRGTPVHSLLANSLGPQVAQATMTATNIHSLLGSMLGGNAKPPAAPKSAPEFDTTLLVRGEDGIWRLGEAASTNAGVLKSLAGSFSLVTTAVIGTGVALRKLNVWEQQFEAEQRKGNTQHRQHQEGAANVAVGRHLNQTIRMSKELPDFAETRQVSTNQVRRSTTEAAIRKEQDNSSLGFEGRQAIRSRSEQELGLKEQEDEARNKMSHLSARKKELDKAQPRLDEDRKKSAEAHQRTIAALNNERIYESGDPRYQPPPVPKPLGTRILSGITKGVVAPVGWASNHIFGDKQTSRQLSEAADYAMTGNETSAMRSAHNEKIKSQIAEAGTSRAGQLTKEAEDQVRLDKEQLAIGNERAQSAAQLLNTLREQTQAARKNYEIDKERISSNRRHVGAMTPGERTRLIALEAKRKRIEAGTGEKFNQFDMEFGKAHAGDGTKLAAAIRKEEESRGRDDRGNDILEDAGDHEGLKNKAEQAQAKQDKEEPELVSHIKDLGQKNEEAGKKLVEAMEKAFAADEFFAQLEATLKSQQEAFEKNIKTMSFWFK